jgi:glycopeptide antibiotics resistance protein
MRRLLPVLAWLLLAAIAFVTLAPIGLRPNSGYSPNIERFLAFGAVGFLFALAYPRRLWLIIAIVLGAAVAFEALQLVSVSRHGRLFDLAVKLAGGGLGIAVGAVFNRVWRSVTAKRAT